MRKRNSRIQVRLDNKELQRFMKAVKKSGLTQEAYLRHLINGVVPRDAPPPDYYAMMRELYRIGNNLNQIAQKAHALQVMDAQRYDEDYRMLESVIRQITSAVVEPKPMEK